MGLKHTCEKYPYLVFIPKADYPNLSDIHLWLENKTENNILAGDRWAFQKPQRYRPYSIYFIRSQDIAILMALTWNGFVKLSATELKEDLVHSS